VAYHFETIAGRSLPVTESVRSLTAHLNFSTLLFNSRYLFFQFESDLSSQCCYETDLHKKLLSRRVSIKILNGELASIGIHKAAAASAAAAAVVEEAKPEEPTAAVKSMHSDGPAAPAHFVRTQAASDLERQMRQKTAAVRMAAAKGITVSAVAPPRMVPIPPPAPEPAVPQAPMTETPKIAPRANVARPSPAGGAVASMLQRKAAFQSVMNSGTMLAFMLDGLSLGLILLVVFVFLSHTGQEVNSISNSIFNQVYSAAAKCIFFRIIIYI
jgi:hypothetical protein